VRGHAHLHHARACAQAQAQWVPGSSTERAPARRPARATRAPRAPRAARWTTPWSSARCCHCASSGARRGTAARAGRCAPRRSASVTSSCGAARDHPTLPRARAGGCGECRSLYHKARLPSLHCMERPPPRAPPPPMLAPGCCRRAIQSRTRPPHLHCDCAPELVDEECCSGPHGCTGLCRVRRRADTPRHTHHLLRKL